tara:strand:- start:2278 stop:2502 length:225 start_codon:yes stop_codon:yes gene_type:complete
MRTYTNITGRSNVEAFEIGGDYIIVRFKGTARIYKYSYKKAGKKHVDYMKSLANKGSGLNGYINSFVKNLYDTA